MNKPAFSICLIAKNEEHSLPHLFSSLEEFKKRGGKTYLLDTGSTDNSVKVAKEFGCIVEEAGDKFIKIIDNADKINKRFIVKGEKPVLKNGDRLFDFASARNYAATMADTDILACPDCDELYSKFDIDKIEEVIKDGAEQLEYSFIFSHDAFGNPAIKFRHCKFYDRRKLKWTGIIHEVLTGSAKKVFLDENIIKLEHFQNEKQDRSGYLRGLAIDCFENQDNDRNSHYFAREMVWTGRPKSAIKEFKRHIAMGKWPAERAQSLIFIGDAYGMLGKEDKQVEFYHKAFDLDASRREAPMRLADFYYKKGDKQRTACYCAEALQVPWNAYYANQRRHYTNGPHELMYWALWGQEQAKYHWEQALEYQPLSTKYLYDSRFFIKLPKVSIVIPSMRDTKELLELIDKTANYPDYEVIVEKDSFENNLGVAKTFNNGVAKSKGELVVYMGDKDIPQPNFLILAVLKMIKEFPEIDGMVGLNDLHWLAGEIATHFLISKKLLPFLDGEIFHSGYYHCGVDNELTERCRKVGKYTWCEEAKINIDHPAFDNSEMDKVYKLSYNAENLKHDRDLLKKRSKELGFELREDFIHPDAKISAVIAVKDRVDLTKNALDSLFKNTKRLGEIIIVDDGSEESFEPYIKDYEKYGIPITHRNTETDNRGVNRGWNIGASLAKFPYLMIFSNDILFSPKWEDPLINSLNDDVWIVSPYHTAGDKLPEDFPEGKDRQTNLDGGVGLPFIGSCFMMAKQTWDKIGPIDERLKIWCGDNYLWETVVADFKKQVKEIPESYIHHFCAQTTKDIPKPILNKDLEAFEIIRKEKGWDVENI